MNLFQSHPLSRTMQAATGAYAVYALVRPGHLGAGLGEGPGHLGDRRLSRTFGVRDLCTTALGVFGPAAVVPAAVATRVAGDLGDALILGSTTTGRPRRRVLTATLGWAALNTAAYALDRRR